MTRYDVVVIGPGRAGTALAVALQRAGHRVVAAAGGSEASRERFRGIIAGVRTAEDPAEVTSHGNLVLLCTPDDALTRVVTDLATADAIHEGHRVVHVAGSVGLAPLRRAALAGARVAACHPAQTFPKPSPSAPPDPEDLVGIAWAVSARDDDRTWADDLVRDLGGDPHAVRDEDRVLYHAALAVGSNAVAAATAVARDLLLGARIEDPAAFLAPLVSASTGNVLEHGANAITGPVVRGDVGTVRRHLAALEAGAPTLADDYRHLAMVILGRVRASLDPETVHDFEVLLDDGDPA